MRDWWDSLKADEQKRRGIFSDQFRDDRKAFRGHYLTNERDVSEHRLGFPNIEARVVGPFGKEYVARPPAGYPHPDLRVSAAGAQHQR